MNEPTAGNIGLTQIHGGLGFMIRVGQWLAGGGWANYQHTFICVDVIGDVVTVVEAEPGGARYGVYGPTDRVLWLDFGLTTEQAAAVANAAERYVGTPYSFLDYFALAAHKFNIPVPFLRRYVASTGHMICSQLVDQCYQDVGIHLFEDHRWPGYVMPTDIYHLPQEAK